MKPEPVNKNIVCSCCGMPWEAHGSTPTLENCVKLLSAENERLATKRWNPYQPITSTTSSGLTLRRAS